MTSFWNSVTADSKIDATQFEFARTDPTPAPQFRGRAIIVLIDDSGSTDNFGGSVGGGGGGRRGGGGYYVRCTRGAVTAEADMIPEISTEAISSSSAICKTKPILTAEWEGVLHTLAIYSRTYNLCGVTLTIYAFSTTLRQLACVTFSEFAPQDAWLEDFARAGVSERHHTPAFGSTNLLGAMTEIARTLVESQEHDIDIILATDGRPSDESPPSATVAELLKTSPSFSNCRIVCIGAGSVRGIGGTTSVFAARGGSRVPVEFAPFALLEQRPDHIAAAADAAAGGAALASGYTECDATFLHELAMSASAGVYTGAYQDYADLKFGVENFLTGCDVFKFAVLLDGKMSVLPEHVCASLERGACAFYTLPGVIGIGGYVVTKNYQIAVDLRATLTAEDAATAFVIGVGVDAWPRRYEDAAMVSTLPSVALQTANGESYTLRPVLTTSPSGATVVRCRAVVRL